MERNGQLGEETKRRVEKSISLYHEAGASHIITTGWDYRQDSDLKIAEVIRDFLINRCGFAPCDVLCDVNSRDTVGDAYFVRRNIVDKMHFKRLLVVTSDYHVNRTREIFGLFYSPSVQVEVFGVDVPGNNDSNVLAHEAASLKAFRSTFDGVDLTSDEEVLKVLSRDHPFYNGAIYPSL